MPDALSRDKKNSKLIFGINSTNLQMSQPLTKFGSTMMLTSDGNLEIGAYVRSDVCYLICVRHLIRSRLVTNRKDLFSLMRAQHVLSYHLI